MKLKRLLVLALAVGGLSLAATTALAAGGPPAQVSPVQFTIPAGQCPDLPADLVLTGRGVSRTTTTVDGNQFQVVTEVTGRAKDNQGGHYQFDYHNALTGSLGGSGTMTDHFSVTGTGLAAGLFSSFAADLTFDANGEILTFDVTSAIGNFELCDPI